MIHSPPTHTAYHLDTSSIKEHDCLPHFLALSGAPLSPAVVESSCYLQCRTNKYFAIGLVTMANASNNCLSAYVHSKATEWYRRFPPVGSPDCADEKDLRPRVKKGTEGQEGDEAVIEEKTVKLCNDDTDVMP